MQASLKVNSTVPQRMVHQAQPPNLTAPDRPLNMSIMRANPYTHMGTSMAPFTPMRTISTAVSAAIATIAGTQVFQVNPFQDLPPNRHI